MAIKSRHRISAQTNKKGKDHSPSWQDCENWDTGKFYKFFHDTMDFYRLEKSGRELKPKVLEWMTANGYAKSQIKTFKDSKDFRSSLTMGAIAASLLKGMTAVREDFNGGRNTIDWLKNEIGRTLEEGKDDCEPVETTKETAQPMGVTIQDRMKESATHMVEDIEDALENFRQDPETFDPKQFKILNLLKGKQAKAAHARLIKKFYASEMIELEELASGRGCEQLKEGYSHLPRKNVKKLVEFYKEIEAACDMLALEQKINKKPRIKKAQPKEKTVNRLKYLKTHEPLKLVSIGATDIIGAKELWIYNTKTRKIGKYQAEDFQELGVKGTSLIGFNQTKSLQKTVRKPEEILKSFKTAGKVQLRTFFDSINAVESAMNGRLNEHIILLKVQ